MTEWTPSATILASPRGTLDQARTFAGRIFAPNGDRNVLAYLAEVFRLAPLVGIDPAVVVAQSHLETAGWKSPRWVQHRNPAGLGIDHDDAPDPATFTGTEAARVHVWALLVACSRFAMVSDALGVPESAKPFQRRWLDKYADPNCPTVRTIGDLNVRYRDRTGEPQATWAWDADYHTKLCERATAIFGPYEEGPTVPAAGGVVFGRVPHPPFTDAIVPKPGEGAGFTRVSPRQIAGVCNHRTYGLGSAWVTHNLFKTGGERQWDALTDYVVGLDGLILRLNDPRGTRSPWANGGSDGLEGDGPAFVQRFGVAGINDRLVSVENVGMDTTPFEGAQFERSAALTAYWHDQARCRWDSYPVHQDFGVVTDMQHYEFATKACPFQGFRSMTDAFQERVREIMREHQGEPATPPPPPPGPVLPPGWTEAKLSKRFGRLTRYHATGTTTHGFSMTGPVSNAWVARGIEEKRELRDLPPATTWTTIEQDGAKLHTILFDGAGLRNWLLVKLAKGDATWRWAL
jgi:hypothetical protein